MSLSSTFPTTGTGTLFERMVETACHEYRWPIVSYADAQSRQCDFFRHNVCIRQHPYTKFYGGEGRCDFVFKIADGVDETWMELKYQDVGGSVDEKLFCTYLHAIYSIPGRKVIIGVNGAELARSPIVAHLKERSKRGWLQPSDKPQSVIQIMTLNEIQKWALSYLKSAL